MNNKLVRLLALSLIARAASAGEKVSWAVDLDKNSCIALKDEVELREYVSFLGDGASAMPYADGSYLISRPTGVQIFSESNKACFKALKKLKKGLTKKSPAK